MRGLRFVNKCGYGRFKGRIIIGYATKRPHLERKKFTLIRMLLLRAIGILMNYITMWNTLSLRQYNEFKNGLEKIGSSEEIFLYSRKDRKNITQELPYKIDKFSNDKITALLNL